MIIKMEYALTLISTKKTINRIMSRSPLKLVSISQRFDFGGIIESSGAGEESKICGLNTGTLAGRKILNLDRFNSVL